MPECCSIKAPGTIRACLDDLTEVAGPVFFVLDEMGKAFQNDDDSFDDIQQRDLFISFCNEILYSWFCMKNTFFVVVGRASFLNYVEDTFYNPCEFERLNIH
ncbi:hypothetical protein HDU77_009764 [Chytriomyces hyalinus]|nr:hypothetical protein HDU77_009764 [Chytriomyces hyalinus]